MNSHTAFRTVTGNARVSHSKDSGSKVFAKAPIRVFLLQLPMLCECYHRCCYRAYYYTEDHGGKVLKQRDGV